MSGSDAGFILNPSDFILTSAEAVGLEPTSEMNSPPVFKTGPSSGRMTSGYVAFCSAKEASFFGEKGDRHQAAGAGVEPTSQRSERRILPIDDPAGYVISPIVGRTVHHHDRWMIP